MKKKFSIKITLKCRNEKLIFLIKDEGQTDFRLMCRHLLHPENPVNPHNKT